MKTSTYIPVMVVVWGWILCGWCAGKTITVTPPGGGGDYNSIQTAVNNSINGDEIQVAPGTYSEAVEFNGKRIRLYSSDGPQVTIINGARHYHVLLCDSSETSATIIEGFTITGGNANGSGWPQLRGGGMYNYNSSPTVIDCIFSGNSATYHGGGAYDYQGSPTYLRCTFDDNFAGDAGGGLCTYTSNPVVTQCIFRNNTATIRGGGMFIDVTGGTVTNCTIYGNSANNGGGMYDNNCSSVVTNSIFWGDTATNGPEFYGGGSIVTYSCVQGGYGGTGNIVTDPNYVDAAGGNLRLTRGSGCIDAGKNAAVPVSVTTDLNGWERFIDDLCTGDTGGGTAPIVDMGAYEFLPADMDGSGGVDLADFSMVAAHWQETGGDSDGADMDCDGVVDLNDMTVLAGWWLKGL
ncbi:MAG: hypothetical protein JW709_12010 [Sedimentisphaerales bacterium]|nr:hypothetical protein [Sedimentisphaerales bacterium]